MSRALVEGTTNSLVEVMKSLSETRSSVLTTVVETWMLEEYGTPKLLEMDYHLNPLLPTPRNTLQHSVPP